MKNLSKILCVLCVLCGLFFTTDAQTKLTSRVLLIPLDDRPPCLQMPVKMGLIGDVEVVTPPRNLLGRFTEFGKSDEIIKWLKTQNLKSFDAAIISLDMLAYGGLVAMREYETTESEAMKRADFIRQIRKIAPKMPIYGSSVIMRLAPTGNVVNESYRANLAKWAEISVDESKRAETAELEKKIPDEALEKYKKARQRDLKLNLYSVELVRDKVIDYLILSQDDAKPNGVHIADREKLIDYVKTQNLGEKVAIQPGADEVSMLLLARTMTDKYKYRPKIKAIYSDEKIADQFMPYEDRPLRKTVSFHIKAVGATEVENEKDADILFYVFVSRFQEKGAEKFIDKILSDHAEKEIHKGEVTWTWTSSKKLIIADVDPKGEIQGGDDSFTLQIIEKIPFLQAVDGFATWNTAGNTIGTALPQGVLMANSNDNLLNLNAKEGKKSTDRATRIFNAQTWFLLNRLLDDYLYHSVVRPEAIKFSRENNWNPFRFDEQSARKVESFSIEKMRPKTKELLRELDLSLDEKRDSFSITLTRWKKEKQFFSPKYSGFQQSCNGINGLAFSLPWGRTFEAEIDFKLDCYTKFRTNFTIL
jgi:hypothetical protein